MPPSDEHFLDFGDGARRVQALRTSVRTAHDRVARIETKRSFEGIQPLPGRFVAAVDEPTIGR
jgi:hypothetical protein